MTCEEGEFSFKLKGKVPYYLSNIFHGNLRDVLTVSCIDGLKLCLPKLPLVALSSLMRDELSHRDEEDHVITTERESSDILQLAWFLTSGCIFGKDVIRLTQVFKEFGINLKTMQLSADFEPTTEPDWKQFCLPSTATPSSLATTEEDTFFVDVVNIKPAPVESMPTDKPAKSSLEVSRKLLNDIWQPGVKLTRLEKNLQHILKPQRQTGERDDYLDVDHFLDQLSDDRTDLRTDKDSVKQKNPKRSLRSRKTEETEELSTKNESHIEKENDEINPHEVPSYLTLLKYTEGYGAGLSIEKAKHDIVKDIFKSRKLDEEIMHRHPSETPRTATSKFISWYMCPYFDEIEQRWGWNDGTLKALRVKEMANILVKNLEKLCPGLTGLKEDISRATATNPIAKAVLFKFQNTIDRERKLFRLKERTPIPVPGASPTKLVSFRGVKRKADSQDVVTQKPKVVETPMCEMTRAAVVVYTEEYGADLVIEKAKHDVVRDIFDSCCLDENVLRRHPTETMETAKRKFISWYVDPFLDGFHEKWGWNMKTLKLKLWPRPVEDGVILLRTLERLCPGLAGPMDSSPIAKAVINKLSNKNSDERRILQRKLNAADGSGEVLPFSQNRKMKGKARKIGQKDMNSVKVRMSDSARGYTNLPDENNKSLDLDIVEDGESLGEMDPILEDTISIQDFDMGDECDTKTNILKKCSPFQDTPTYTSADGSLSGVVKVLSRAALLTFTEQFGFDLDINKARHEVVKDIFRSRCLDQRLIERHPTAVINKINNRNEEERKRLRRIMDAKGLQLERGNKRWASSKKSKKVKLTPTDDIDNEDVQVENTANSNDCDESFIGMYGDYDNSDRVLADNFDADEDSFENTVKKCDDDIELKCEEESITEFDTFRLLHEKPVKVDDIKSPTLTEKKEAIVESMASDSKSESFKVDVAGGDQIPKIDNPKRRATPGKPVLVRQHPDEEKQNMIDSFLEYTEQYGLNLSIDTAKHDVVKDIYKVCRLDDKVLALHPAETIRTATSKFTSWFLGPYFEGFEDRFGWTIEMLELKLWPRREDCDTLCRNLEKLCPGLTQRADPDSGDIVRLPMGDAIIKKIENRCGVERKRLQVTRKSKGLSFSLPGSKKLRSEKKPGRQKGLKLMKKKDKFLEDGSLRKPTKSLNRQQKFFWYFPQGENGVDLTKPYKCHRCVRRFEYELGLQRHLKRHDSSNPKDIYFCLHCNDAVFEVRKDFIKHRQNCDYLVEPEFHKRCLKGMEYGGEAAELAYHFPQFEFEDKSSHFKCKRCIRTFEAQNAFEQHLRRHLKNRDVDLPYTCLYCNKKHFDNYFQFLRHEKVCKGKPETHDLMPEDVRSVYEEHNLLGADQRCPTCGQWFNQLKYQNKKEISSEYREETKSLNFNIKRNHYKTMGEFHIHTCASPDCEFAFKSWEEHLKHIKDDHGGCMMHRCGKCPLTFDSIQSRDEHRAQAHVNDGLETKFHWKGQNIMIQCELCGKDLYKRYYKDHMAAHLNLRPHQCRFCPERFNSDGNRNAHERHKHLGKPRIMDARKRGLDEAVAVIAVRKRQIAELEANLIRQTNNSP